MHWTSPSWSGWSWRRTRCWISASIAIPMALRRPWARRWPRFRLNGILTANRWRSAGFWLHGCPFRKRRLSPATAPPNCSGCWPSPFSAGETGCWWWRPLSGSMSVAPASWGPRWSRYARAPATGSPSIRNRWRGRWTGCDPVWPSSVIPTIRPALSSRRR